MKNVLLIMMLGLMCCDNTKPVSAANCFSLQNTNWIYNGQKIFYFNTECNGDFNENPDIYIEDETYIHFNEDSVLIIENQSSYVDCRNYELDNTKCNVKSQNIEEEGATISFEIIDYNEEEQLDLTLIQESYMDGEYEVEGFCLKYRFVKWDYDNFLCED